MDNALIRACNDRVKANDTVYVLGDFAMESGVKAKSMLSRLQGRKILIRGNHDRAQGDWTAQGWSEVHDALLIEVNQVPLYLHHYPIRDWPGKWQGVAHLYGHVHGSLEPKPGSMDVGVDSWGGAPVSLDEVCQSIQLFDLKAQERQDFRAKVWER